MATSLDPKQAVSFEELLVSQVVQQEAHSWLLVEKGIFSKGEQLFNEIEALIEYDLILST